MRVIDKINLYLDNIINCRKVGTNIDYFLLTDEDLIGTIQNNASLRYSYLKKDNELLSDILYSVKVEDFDEEYISDLEYFSSKIFDYSASIDCAIYLEINKKLLEYAKYINKDELIIKYTYNVAIAFYYLNNSTQFSSLEYKEEIVRLNEEVVQAYFDKFDTYDETTKFNLIRCYGNIKLGIPKTSKENILKVIKIVTRIVDFCSNEKIRESNPNIPFDNIIYSTNFDFLSSIGYLRSVKLEDYTEFENMLVKYQLKSVEYLENKEKDNQVDENRVQNWRLKYYGLAVRFHGGLIKIDELLEYLISEINSISSNDFSAPAIRKIVINYSHLLEYYNDFTDDSLKNKYKEQIDQITLKTYKYVEVLRLRNYPQLLNYVFTVFTLIQTYGAKDKYVEILDSILFNHRPTYIHSLMVAILAKTITNYILKTNPSFFIGALDIKNVDEVLERKDEIINLVFRGGVYHDIGKTLVISYISNYERSLTNEEFNCVKEHTNFGYNILESAGEKDLAVIAKYHHKTYDELGGYPKTETNCPLRLKTIVDIISISDSLDAASDFIGRSYKNYKKLDEIVLEFKNESGTRYNPLVVKIFDDKLLYDEILSVLREERTKLYIETYRNKKYIV